MIVSFTGTGNSRYCAQFLAQKLEDQQVDSFSFLREGVAARLSSETPWVFVAPTYGWQLPHVFQDFLRNSRFSGSRAAWFVMTCGQDIGSAAAKNQALCREMGLRYQGTLEVVMPENYIALFQAPQEDQARTIIAAAHPVLEQGAACIRAGRPFPEKKTGLADRLKSGPVNAAFYRFIIKAKPFAATAACTGCGQCETLCPLANIRLTDSIPTWGPRCTHCMACICGCPAKAIEYGRSSRGKVRYQCPAYTDQNA